MKIFRLFIVAFLVLSLFGCGENEQSSIKTISKNNEEFFIYNDIEYPSVFGEPQLTIDEINSLGGEEAQDKICTYIDYLLYVKNLNFSSTQELIKYTYELLAGDYDEIGIVSYLPISYMMYIKTNDKYYPIDIHNYDKDWLKNYNLEQYCFDNLNDMCKALKGSTIYTYQTECLWSIGDDIPVYKYKVIDIICNCDKEVIDYLGTKVYEHAGTQIPLYLGLPEYSNEQIDEIIASNDLKSVASKINTLADAVNYVKRAGFLFEDETAHHTYEDISYVDVGNLGYSDDKFHNYTVSGLEMLQLKFGQCTASSTLFYYLLRDNYDEIGYFHLTEHCMLYMIGYDGMYYIVDPSQYLLFADEVYDENVIARKHLYWTDGEYFECCSDTLEGLVNNFIASKRKPMDPDVELDLVATYVYDGINCMGYKYYDKDTFDIVVPTDAVANVWYGNCGILYEDPKHSTDLEYVIGLPSEGTVFQNTPVKGE